MIFLKKTGLKITILGAGSFGTSLAITFASKSSIWLWGNEPEIIDEITNKRENKKYLPSAHIPENINATTNLEKALQKADLVLFAVPSYAMREVASKAKSLLKRKTILISVAKGLEEETGLRMSQVLRKIMPWNPVVVISGPTHAEELANEVPTTVVAASNNDKFAKKVQEALITPTFRIYTNRDIIGVELGGVLKNIIALAAGISDGLGFGSNAIAALITRGLVEIRRFGKKLGAKYNTFLGLSGLGDLIVTCTSNFSRNWTLGNKIGKGKSLDEAISDMSMVCEGVKATRVVHKIAKKKKIEMPITEEIYKVLFENKSPKEVATSLMTRSIKSENKY